jgi:predicted transposase/invertase (TIGR01784 family)
MTLADRLVARGMQEGMQRGVQQGMEQGMQQGMQQGILVIAKSMLLKGLEHELISETTGLTRQELVALQKGLSH